MNRAMTLTMTTQKKSTVKLLTLPLILFVFISTSGCGDKSATNESSGNESNNKVSTASIPPALSKVSPSFIAPDTELVDMDGKKHKMSDYRGKPVIVNFWATWCPPCRAELPSMNRAWAKVKDEGIQMLAVNMGESEDTIFPFTGEYPIDFTILLDSNGSYALEWKVQGLPTTYVVDAEGNVVYQAVGGREWDDDSILDMVRGLKK